MLKYLLCVQNQLASIHSAEDELRKVSLLAAVALLAAITSPILRAQEGPDIPSRVGVGVKLSLLGVGGEAAFAVTHRTNVRVGFNAFSYSRSFDKDGITYGGNLSFRSVQATYDIFPFAGGFHLSPGLLAYNGNSIGANVSAAGGQSFSLGGATFTSDATNPLGGAGKLNFPKVAPMFLVGWGNLVPRSHRHISVNAEVGVVYQGQPRVSLALSGNACDANNNCGSVNSLPGVQADIQTEQQTIKHDVSILRFYPITSVSVGFKF
jgi:hypothetical protein